MVFPLLSSARLLALGKKAGDVRPIAVGEVLWRLVSKILLQENTAAVKNLPWLSQITNKSCSLSALGSQMGDKVYVDETINLSIRI